MVVHIAILKKLERQGIAKFLYFDTEEELAAQITENISARLYRNTNQSVNA